MTGVSTSSEEVSENGFYGEQRPQLNETHGIFLKRRADLPAGIFTRSNAGDILKNAVKCGF